LQPRSRPTPCRRRSVSPRPPSPPWSKTFAFFATPTSPRRQAIPSERLLCSTSTPRPFRGATSNRSAPQNGSSRCAAQVGSMKPEAPRARFCVRIQRDRWRCVSRLLPLAEEGRLSDFRNRSRIDRGGRSSERCRCKLEPSRRVTIHVFALDARPTHSVSGTLTDRPGRSPGDTQ
jgi:hypothetical protein